MDGVNIVGQKGKEAAGTTWFGTHDTAEKSWSGIKGIFMNLQEK